ncbi:unnamed protein product [Microthlaspi erraticum]|uniref:Uncharacterized protein n=1 Tax=Microthlaspi erraticum TaxID=1685480 RepID=A0A6D2JWF8_9BRAS|nr:unnamed protein product [Microthlaspi erraticum]
MDQQGRKQAKWCSIESFKLDRVRAQEEVRSTSYAEASSIEHMQNELDRTHCRRRTRSIPCRASQLDRSRSISAVPINPAQMTSQPFDLLGANRLDRTAANRIEPSRPCTI